MVKIRGKLPFIDVYTGSNYITDVRSNMLTRKLLVVPLPVLEFRGFMFFINRDQLSDTELILKIRNVTVVFDKANLSTDEYEFIKGFWE